MSDINYNALSHEQLIALLQSKDKELEEQEEKYEELAEAFENFSSEVFYSPAIDELNVSSPDDINFSDLTVIEDDIDNSREVSSAESTHEDNKNAHEALISSIYEARKNLFNFAIDSWITKHKLGIGPNLMDSSSGIYDRINVDYNDYSFVDKQLVKLIKYETVESFISGLGLQRTLNVFSHAYSTHSEENKTDDFGQKVEKIINIAMKRDPLQISFQSFTTMEEKEKFLNKYFPGSEFLIINKIKKEKEALSQIIDEQSLTVTAKRRM